MERVVAILRALLRRALSEHGPEPPALTDIIIESARGRLPPRLGAQFADGHRAWTTVKASDCYGFCERYTAWDLESLRHCLLREAHDIYSQMLDDHIVELGLRHRRERLEQLRRNATNPALIEQIRRSTYELEQQIQRHYRRQPPNEIDRPTVTRPHHRDPPARLRAWCLQRWSHFSRSARLRRHAFDSPANEAAQNRGLRLLKENLSPAQRKQYEKLGYFYVIGGETGRRFRIRYGSQMNVDLLDKRSRSLACLCFVPEGCLVVGDVMLAQKLALELFESDAINVANMFGTDCSRSVRVDHGRA